MHLGVIPDGNRRYAENQGISEREAYRQAKEVVEEIGRELGDSGREMTKEVDEVTFYLLSEENLRRDKEELQTLFELLEEYIEEVSEEYGRNGFVFNWASTFPEALPEHLQKRLKELEEEHNEGDKQLNMLLSYTGKEDLLQAAEKVSNNGGDFSRESIRKHLEIRSDIDFVIRTGNNPTRECLSGFPIWNTSYAEFYHVKKNFPRLEVDDVEEALEHFRQLRKKKGE